MINVNDFITLLQKLPDKTLPIILDHGERPTFVYLDREPTIVRVRVAYEDVLELAHEDDERGFAAVHLHL